MVKEKVRAHRAERHRQARINRELEGLTDHGFLDRVSLGMPELPVRPVKGGPRNPKSLDGIRR